MQLLPTAAPTPTLVPSAGETLVLHPLHTHGDMFVEKVEKLLSRRDLLWGVEMSEIYLCKNLGDKEGAGLQMFT